MSFAHKEFTVQFFGGIFSTHTAVPTNTSKYPQHPRGLLSTPKPPLVHPTQVPKERGVSAIRLYPLHPHERLMRQGKDPTKALAPLKGHLFQKNLDPSEEKGGK